MTAYTLEPVEGNPFANGYTLEAIDGNPFAREHGLGAGVQHGVEQVLLDAQNTTDKLKDYFGMAKGRSLATALAEKLHNPYYESGGAGLMDPTKSIGERLTYAPQVMAEGLPMAVNAAAQMALPGGLAAKALRMLATQGYSEAGQKLDQSGGSIPRAALATGLDTGLSMVGAGSALGAKTIGRAALGGAIDAAGQTTADKLLMEGKTPSIEDLIVTGAMGGAAGGAVRGAQEVPGAARAVAQIPEKARWSRFEGSDPVALATAAQRLKDATGGYGKISEPNAEDIRTKAIAEAKASAAFAAKNSKFGGRNWVEQQLNNLTSGGNVGPSEAYVQANAALARGEPVNAEHLATLRDALGGTGVGKDWLNKIEEASILGELGNVGLAKGDARMGGTHATPLGQSIEWLSNKFGGGVLSAGLAGHLMGSPLGKYALGIGAGSTALKYGMRGIDKLTGFDNPVGRFAARYGELKTQTPTPVAPVTPNVTPIKSVMADAQRQANPQPPAAPQGPLSLFQQDMGVTPGQAPTPSENKLIGQILALNSARGKAVNMRPRPGEDLTALPERVLPRGADASFRKPPAPVKSLPTSPLDAKINALADKRFKGSIQVEPSDAFKQAKAAAMAKREGLAKAKKLFGPSEEPKASKESPKQQTQAAPMGEAMAPKWETREIGPNKIPVTVNVNKFSDVEGAWRGIGNKVARREAFVERAKAKLPEESRASLDRVMREKFVKTGEGRDSAFAAYSKAVDEATQSAKLRKELKDMFKKRGSGLWSLKHWNDD